MNLFRTTLLTALFVSIIPFVVDAQVFKPLVEGLGVPGLTGDPTLSQYINGLFNLALVLGSIIAVIIITFSGLQYMSTDAMYQKKESIYRITYAVMGLLMLLGTWLFFNEINPRILDLQLKPAQARGVGATGTQAPGNQNSVPTNNVTPGPVVDRNQLSRVQPNQRQGICGTDLTGTYCGYSNTTQCAQHLGSNAGCGTYTTGSSAITSFSAQCDSSNGSSCVSQLESYDYWVAEADPTDRSKRVVTFFKTQNDCSATYSIGQCQRDTTPGSRWQERLDSGRTTIRLQ